MSSLPQQNTHLVILGAGPCGLYAALTGMESYSYETVTLWEKAPHAGGLAAGYLRGENWYDLGVHMLHAHDHEVFQTCANIMADERITVPLKAHIKWQGKEYHYPLRGRDILSGIPPWTLFRCVSGLLLAEFQSRWSRRPSGESAESALCALYGVPLYEFFFEKFTQKYWGIHPRDLSAEFVKLKMPRLSAVDVIKNIFDKLKFTHPQDRVEGALRSEVLHYSKTGAETLPRTIAQHLQQQGVNIHYNSQITEIHHTEGLIQSVTVKNHTQELCSQKMAKSHFVSTIPLPFLVRALRPLAPDSVLHAASQLRYKPMAVYAILVKKQRCMNALYTYYRDRIFHRVGEPKNAGLKVIPPNHTTLIVEVMCEYEDNIWNGSAFDRILEDLEAEGLCRANEIAEHYLIQSEHAYPVFVKGVEHYLARVNEYLSSFKNLKTTGRQGAFTYPNMHTAMRQGAEAVHTLNK